VPGGVEVGDPSRALAAAPAGRRAIRGALDDAVEIAYGPAMG
jgi:hypothetical protein